MPGPSKSQLKINALTRLVKEYDEYVEEEATIRNRLSALESENPADEYEIRRTQRILDETRRVMERVRRSIEDHVSDVNKLGSLKPEEEKQAKQALEAAATKI